MPSLDRPWVAKKVFITSFGPGAKGKLATKEGTRSTRPEVAQNFFEMSSAVNGSTSHAQDPPVAIWGDSDDDPDPVSSENVGASPGTHLHTHSTFKHIEKNITHRIEAGGSILALVVNENDGCLIAGLQGGDVVVCAFSSLCPSILVPCNGHVANEEVRPGR